MLCVSGGQLFKMYTKIWQFFNGMECVPDIFSKVLNKNLFLVSIASHDTKKVQVTINVLT